MDWVHERLEAANSSGQTEREALANLYFWTFGVFLSIICSIGIITNILNIYALAVTLATKKRPMYYFLLTMAAADLGVSIFSTRSFRIKLLTLG
ncbi:hypothetical protein EB796_007301 [Bugula neritina]|uniref:G-protein coupled receptors family 1 profile domain-containing protein n=1 Tax=Bugula neritina TaxID=10212 RepID=A0A7J7K6Y5_BUGNE|nr:hypothetical protein EB796_007301 [Bugula neritina]